MGLTTWKNAPDGRILKSDTYVAKNYLDEKQIRQLERSISGYFDYIEGLIERENTFTMAEYDIFNKTRKIESDFDRAVKNMLSSNDTE